MTVFLPYNFTYRVYDFGSIYYSEYELTANTWCYWGIVCYITP